MKKLVAICMSLGALLGCSPMTVLAAETAAEGSAAVPFWLCVPFAGLLLCIALFPLLKPVWWENHQPYAVIFWSLLFIIPYALSFSAGTALETVLECMINDYLTFIILLFGLFCVSGNITMTGDLAGSPRINVGLLVLGTLLSSWIGTTGASMLMVRPVIKMNSWRRRKRNIIVFLIFMVSTIGGVLTPIGDPPLLMGFLRGVPFFWSLRMLPVLLFNMVLRLFIFCGTLPGLPAFQDAAGNVKGLHIFGEVTLGYPSIIEIVIILLAAFLSFKTTGAEIRRENHFTWGAIKEVAVLFVGIFITMQPALMILKANGANLGITEPFQMFWSTGFLSSFLDNTPTYLVFLTTAGSLGFTEGMVTTLGTVPVKMLMAISAGAVFMGANTYIGNAPNFMVKSIADENGIHMPSFFGYLKWSLGILIPVFILDMFIFFM